MNEAAVSTAQSGTPPRMTGQSQPITPRTRVVEAPTGTPLKRRYVAGVHDVEVVRKIRQNEVEQRDRNTVLRGTKANVRRDLAKELCNWLTVSFDDRTSPQCEWHTPID